MCVGGAGVSVSVSFARVSVHFFVSVFMCVRVCVSLCRHVCERVCRSVSVPSLSFVSCVYCLYSRVCVCGCATLLEPRIL